MDNATHAFAGLLLADATSAWIERRSRTTIDRRLQRIVVGVGIVAAELPDADLLYSGPVVGMGKLGYLLHHRGHTHTVVFALIAALVIWWIARALRPRDDQTANAASNAPLLALAVAGTLSHLLLDYSNSYGVHPFWPWDNRWYYGDAVFIAEPWLWLVAIPPLLFGPRRWWSRALLVVLFGLMLLASWTLGELSQALAIVVTVAAIVWLVTQRWVPASRRTALGLMAWLVVESVFASSSVRARTFAQVPPASDERVLDVALTPAAANPFCFNALVVSVTNDTYRVRSATVAPWGSSGDTWNSVTRCSAGVTPGRFGADGRAIGASTDVHVRWSEQWTGSLAELRELESTRCAFAAALRFMRVPLWRVDSTDAVHLDDARFGTSSEGFAGLRVGTEPCDLGPRAWIPPWVPPRADALN